MRSKQWLGWSLCVAALVTTLAGADDKPAQEKETAAKKPAFGLDMGMKLVAGLKATPGCLGVETALTASGKQVIFAFFENKKAATAWYFSPVHQSMMDLIEPERDKKMRPMRRLPDDVPIMTVASISFKGKPAYPDAKLPFSQIAIEMYTPMSGGLDVGGGFAPDAFRAVVKKAEKKN